MVKKSYRSILRSLLDQPGDSQEKQDALKIVLRDIRSEAYLLSDSKFIHYDPDWKSPPAVETYLKELYDEVVAVEKGLSRASQKHRLHGI